MFKSTKGKLIFVIIFSIICITITALLIMYSKIDIEDQVEQETVLNTQSIQTSNDEQLHALTIHIFGINSEEDVLKILKND